MIYVILFVFLSCFAPATTSLVIMSGIQFALAAFVPTPFNDTDTFAPTGTLITVVTGLEIVAALVLPVLYLLVCLVFTVRKNSKHPSYFLMVKNNRQTFKSA